MRIFQKKPSNEYPHHDSHLDYLRTSKIVMESPLILRENQEPPEGNQTNDRTRNRLTTGKSLSIEGGHPNTHHLFADGRSLRRGFHRGEIHHGKKHTDCGWPTQSGVTDLYGMDVKHGVNRFNSEAN